MGIAPSHNASLTDVSPKRMSLGIHRYDVEV